MTTFADPGTTPSVLDPTVGDTPAADVDFADLGLPRPLVEALARQGITTPFEIQRATMPDALAGRDVLGRGQTGSGKTLAFGLPLIARLADRNRARPLHPRALVLVPTRELAMQVNDALMPLGKAVGIFLKTAVGGVPYDRQIDALRRGVEIVVATPGRLGDLINRGVCRLDDVEVTVLDEADQMADMGFLPEVTQLLAKTPAGGQRLLFSATLDGDVDSLVKRFMTDPVTHSTAPSTASVSTMDHHMLLIPPHDKFAVAASIAARDGRTMLFARTQLGVDRLVEQLAAVGVRAGGLHGGKTQRMRTKTLAEFREGRMNVLVATDVAARGIHVDGVSLVLHIDPPKDPKDYLHRAGRTARAGESGAVATLVLPKQRRTTLAMMEKAGVAPAETRVRVGDPTLAELTGAREPSGVPVREEPEPRRAAGQRRYGDRPDRGERRYGDRPTGERRFGDRDGRGERFGERRFDRPAGERSFGDRAQRGFGDRTDRPAGERSFGDRGQRGFGDRTDRPAGERSFGDRGQRGFGDRTDRPAGERSFGDRGDRGYADRPQGERRYGDRDGRGERFGERRFDGRSDRPAGERSFGDRGERRFDGRGDRPAGDRSFGDRGQRGFGDRTDRPAGEHRYGDRPQGERRFGGEQRGTERRGGFGPEARGDDRPRDDRRGFGGRPPARTH
ncbi:Superfamily II DNA and RNA helicase [Micromonospora purpureochromogenes]|uniref:Superfamily II DNA and RNA helicase n=1 Tax=Micromonospora purpureochromogenes TaxID=47872 RepID=A0A1C4U6X4_9ACTN|nr:DEAD/DEAH box helicase [Micromonospora purpureochromogenes]SCE67406.1 Superfamily II DNA and RNA helicase [Micromonospora purpureochromogenes]